MTLKILASGSLGNCYVLTYENKKLVIEAGIPIKEIKKGIDFDIENLEGVICSHVHKDHSLSMEKLANMGIRTYQPYMIDKDILKTVIGPFTITSFPVPHNGTPNRGFIISTNKDKLCFVTDAEYIPYKLREQRFTAMLVECNYQADRITTENGHRDHVFLGHCELSTCRDFVAENVTDALKTIILIHPSQSGGLDKARAVNEIQAVAPGTKVYMATKGLEVDI